MRRYRYGTGNSRRFRYILAVLIVLVFAGSVTCAYALPSPDAGSDLPSVPSESLPDPVQDDPAEPAVPDVPDTPSEDPQPSGSEPAAAPPLAEEPAQTAPEVPAEDPAVILPAEDIIIPLPETDTLPAEIIPEETEAESAEELLDLMQQSKLRSRTIKLGADFSVTLEAPLYIAEGRSLNLDLNNHTLILIGEKEDTSWLLDVGGSLTVYDSSEEAGGLLRLENALSGIRIHGTRAAFIMTSGCIETGTNAKRAVLAVGGSMLTMAGGCIRGSEETSLLAPEDTADGGAVYLNGQGTSMQFVGGSITGTAGWNGGAFYIGAGASLMMRENLEEDGSSGIGAEILDCRAALHGGAIYIAPGGVAAITGKSLLNNRAAGNGGAVAIEGGTLTLSGGQIAGNAAGAPDLPAAESPGF